MMDFDIYKDLDFICFSLDMFCVFFRFIFYLSFGDIGYFYKGIGSLRE